VIQTSPPLLGRCCDLPRVDLALLEASAHRLSQTGIVNTKGTCFDTSSSLRGRCLLKCLVSKRTAFSLPLNLSQSSQLLCSQRNEHRGRCHESINSTARSHTSKRVSSPELVAMLAEEAGLLSPGLMFMLVKAAAIAGLTLTSDNFFGPALHGSAYHGCTFVTAQVLA